MLRIDYVSYHVSMQSSPSQITPQTNALNSVPTELSHPTTQSNACLRVLTILTILFLTILLTFAWMSAFLDHTECLQSSIAWQIVGGPSTQIPPLVVVWISVLWATLHKIQQQGADQLALLTLTPTQ